MPGSAMASNAAISSPVGRVASIEKPRTNCAIAGAMSLRPFDEGLMRAARAVIALFLVVSAHLFAPTRDHIGFVVEPEAAALVQHLARGIEIAAVGDDVGEPVVLDLRHIDRRVPGREQRRGS